MTNLDELRQQGEELTKGIKNTADNIHSSVEEMRSEINASAKTSKRILMNIGMSVTPGAASFFAPGKVLNDIQLSIIQEKFDTLNKNMAILQKEINALKEIDKQGQALYKESRNKR